ncbi:MAG: gliding motility-associated C-terminal domain-containing protein [Bacteroidales bacterium]|nr:gliding motility-associated C-terminal domain-containing protein [Bacteroidales bacterium]
MKIEDLFKETMSKAKQKAPDNLWDKIQNNINQVPQNTNINTNTQNIITNTSSTLSTTLVKVVATTLSIAAASVGGYLIYDNINQNKESQPSITQTKIETPKKIETTITPTTIIVSQNTPSPKQEIVITETSIEITPIDTTTKAIHTPQTKQETTIITHKQPKIEPTPTQSQIAENKAIEENIIKEEQPVQTKIEEFNPNIRRPNFISPNNDGINDVFKIDNLEAYPDNEIVIFDKNGRIVFQAVPYNNDWDAANIQQGTYFYKLLIKEGQNKKIFKGSITIML